jgi:nitrite reductase/ring-hydroxylating ferredoxin subunit
MAWSSLCDFSDLTEGMGKPVSVDGYDLAVFLQNGQVFVMDERCPHAGGAMSAGWIDDGCAVCPLHGWAFDVKTGALRDGFSDEPMLKVYPSRIVEAGERKLVQADLPMP